MNAVITKPRNKAAKRPAIVKTELPAVTIADIRQWIGTAEQKLEMAFDAIPETGEPLDLLLEHISHDLMCKPCEVIQRDDLTQADAWRVYGELCTVLACIHAAIKLAEGTVLVATLNEAWQLLEAAQNALEPVNDAVRGLPKGGPAHDFERGRNLAIGLLTDCRRASEATECHRQNRVPSAPQANIVSDFVIDTMNDQSLLGGFASVLSCVLSQQGIEPEYFADLCLAETQAGEPGADGTRTGETDDSEEVASKPGDDSSVPKTKNLALIFADSNAMLLESVGILEARLTDHGSLGEVAYGALRLARVCVADFEKAQTIDDYEDISAPIGSALAVLEAANDTCDDIVLYGAIRLLELCKETLDELLVRTL